MRKSYFADKGVWLKGNLHSHTTVSDGTYTPEEMAQDYARHGYDFISITDHNIYVEYEDLEVFGPLELTGVEHDLLIQKFVKCIHVVGTGMPDKKSTDYECRKYSTEEISDQAMIDMMVNDGQFVVLAHPVWSRMEPEEVLNLNRFHAIEVFNNGCENLCHAGHSEVYWDMLLRKGRKVFATASDDTHKKNDAFGGWIWVKAENKSKPAIMDALFRGQFYASSGPVIHDYEIEGDQVYITCSECKEIHFITYPPRGYSQFAENDCFITEAQYTLKGWETYVRIECVDKEGRVAWTNPIFFDPKN